MSGCVRALYEHYTTSTNRSEWSCCTTFRWCPRHALKKTWWWNAIGGNGWSPLSMTYGVCLSNSSKSAAVVITTTKREETQQQCIGARITTGDNPSIQWHNHWLKIQKKTTDCCTSRPLRTSTFRMCLACVWQRSVLASAETWNVTRRSYTFTNTEQIASTTVARPLF